MTNNPSAHSAETLTAINQISRNPFRWREWRVQDCVIQCTKGPHEGEFYDFSQETLLLGRANWCDIAIPRDSWASKQHCELSISPESVIIRDCQSHNGTLLDGHVIYEAQWTPGAPLHVGESVFHLPLRGSHKELKTFFHDPGLQMVGQSPAMRKLFAMLPRVAKLDTPVLLQGETGTGKSSLARSIHQQSPRKDGPFVVVNCGAIAPSLIEASFFGYEKGAFTGAQQSHRGFLEQAKGGTLLLDEIGELPLALQPRLLDVLERQRVQRLGSETPIGLDFRLLTATNKDLKRAVTAGTFREDLYYRIAVMTVGIPPLRERIEDLPLLLNLLLHKLYPGQAYEFTEGAMGRLEEYLWPGNIRELRNVIERSVAFVEDNVLKAEDLYLPMGHDELNASPKHTHIPPAPPAPQPPAPSQHSLKAIMEEVEREVLVEALKQSDNKVKDAAKALDISKVWLYNRLKKYDIPLPSKKKSG